MTDTNGYVEYVNPKFTQISGYTFAEVKGQNPRILSSGQKTPDEIRELWETISSGKQWRGVFHNRHKNGRLYWESDLIAPVVDPQGNITHYVAIKEDITQRREAEEELRKREINFKRVVNILPQMVAYVDRDLCCRCVNKTYAELFPDRELVGRSVSEVIGEDAFEKTRSFIDQVFQGKTVYYSLELRYPGIGERFIEACLVPDYSSGDKVEGYYAILHDLSHLEMIENSIRKAKEEAEAANKLKSEFLANMSHEIRTPLNGIIGILQLLQTSHLDTEQLEFLQAAIKSSQLLACLLNDILDISRIEAGRIVFHERCFDTVEIKQALWELFSQSVRDKGIGYAFHRGGDVPQRLLGDDARLLQVLFNLVGNSIKFIEKGRVDVGVWTLPFTAGSPVRLLFAVVDTGPGIPEWILRDIFEPFVQSDGSYTRRHQGVGLGLSIVRKLVVRMGGSLCVDSKPGLGTSVYLSLPFGLPKTSLAKAERETVCNESLGTLRVLLVEDDEVNMLCGERLLRKKGYDIATARNGQEALEILLERQDFDIVLMDVQMPIFGWPRSHQGHPLGCTLRFRV